jgi:hypothetical protein
VKWPRQRLVVSKYLIDPSHVCSDMPDEMLAEIHAGGKKFGPPSNWQFSARGDPGRYVRNRNCHLHTAVTYRALDGVSG